MGVDDSDGSVAALRWAMRDAQLRDARLEVVHAWHYPLLEAVATTAYGLDDKALEEGPQAVLDQSLAAAGAPPPGVVVESVLVHAEPAKTLLDMSTGAELLVVGSRGRGGFAILALGSVSQQVVSHASCPVVVVRPEVAP